MSCGSIFDFPINCDLITSVTSAKAKYIADLEAKKELEEKQKREQLKIRTEEAKRMGKKNRLENIDKVIKVKNCDLKVAEYSREI